jgi:hypothetical protein
MREYKDFAANLLELAADTFSNHGCNDYEIADTQENREIVREMNQWEGLTGKDAEWVNANNGKLIVHDSTFM